MQGSIEIFKKKPNDFSAKVEVAACYLELDHKLLLLERAEGKIEGGKWGVPAGKLEKGETPAKAALRELMEETGIKVFPDQIQAIGALYIRKPEVEYIYHLFQIFLRETPDIVLSNEHTKSKWVRLEQLNELSLMAGAHEAASYYKKMRIPWS